MSISPEETQIIRSILQHCEDGTTDMQPELMRNPVTTYTDPEINAREIETLFRKFPIIMGHSKQLPDAGSYITNDELGVPLLITRNKDGQVKAFMNVCRHRGARLTESPCGPLRPSPAPITNGPTIWTETFAACPTPLDLATSTNKSLDWSSCQHSSALV